MLKWSSPPNERELPEMATYMAVCTFKEGTDMADVFAIVAEEQARVAALVAEGRLGSIHLALERGTVFIETFADDEQEAAATIRELPMAIWWDLEMYPIAAPAIRGTA